MAGRRRLQASHAHQRLYSEAGQRRDLSALYGDRGGTARELDRSATLRAPSRRPSVRRSGTALTERPPESRPGPAAAISVKQTAHPPRNRNKWRLIVVIEWHENLAQREPRLRAIKSKRVDILRMDKMVAARAVRQHQIGSAQHHATFIGPANRT